MANEVELKLALAAADQTRFLRHPLLAGAVSRHSETLDNIYFDTPNLILRRNGVALRLRKQGRRWLQTVKLAGKATGGLTSRPEWETPYNGQLDFSPIEITPVREWLQNPKLLSRIFPICQTRFRRITWRFTFGDGAVLLTLDRGWITAEGRREAISELELELDGAPVSAIFSIASRLAEQVALAPAVFSKAERGYRLHADTPLLPFEAQPVTLNAGMSTTTAFVAIGHACLHHLQQNHPGALSSNDPEYICQMRSALQRLQASVILFAPVLPEALEAMLSARLTMLAADLDRVYDTTTVLSDIVDPVDAALPDEPRLSALATRVKAAGVRARRNAIAMLASPTYGQILLEIMQALETLPAETGVSVSASSTPAVPDLASFANHQVQRWCTQVRQLAQAARHDDPAALQTLHNNTQPLHVALEFFSPLSGAEQTSKTMKKLERLQNVLGQLVDLANAGDLLMECAGNDARLREAVTLIGGWHGKRHAALLAKKAPQRIRRVIKERLTESGPQGA